MTDPINAALDRLQEYAAAHPEHDTDELVAQARAAQAAAQGEAGSECPGCEGSPAGHNNPCGVCGRPAQPAPPAEGEVAELVAKLRRLAPQNPLGSADPTITRAAELLERHAAPVPVPVAVSERPWEREGWCDMDGECWWCPPDGPAYWSMVNPAMVYGGWLLPHWTIHQPPQGGEVE